MARALGMGEYPDPTPLEVPGDLLRPPTLEERMQQFIMQQLSARAENTQVETFEEADDFEEDDLDAVPLTDFQVALMAADWDNSYDPEAQEVSSEKVSEETSEATTPTETGESVD